MKLLFITRTYPPLVGGMEKFASDFYDNYRKVGDIELLANSGGKTTIIPFFLKSLFTIALNSGKYDVIHLYDAVLFPLIPFIKLFSRAKISFTVNGLDIAFARFGYQKIMPFFLKWANRVIAISHYTMEQCALRGIPEDKLVVIPVGIDFGAAEFFPEDKRSTIMSRFGIPVDQKTILISVGRLVQRKGHAWFIEYVLTKLPDRYIYLIVGDGEERNVIVETARRFDLVDRVYLLGRVSEEEKNCVYQIADMFVMPNVRVENDQEGFGIVLLEAGLYGLPVIASKIEGIQDAVLEDATGHLIAEKDVRGFVNAILHGNLDRASLPAKVALHFGWENIIKSYYREFQKMHLGHNSKGVV